MFLHGLYILGLPGLVVLSLLLPLLQLRVLQVQRPLAVELVLFDLPPALVELLLRALPLSDFGREDVVLLDLQLFQGDLQALLPLLLARHQSVLLRLDHRFDLYGQIPGHCGGRAALLPPRLGLQGSLLGRLQGRVGLRGRPPRLFLCLDVLVEVLLEAL